MKSGRTQVEIIALYEELGSYRAVAALWVAITRRSSAMSRRRASSAAGAGADALAGDRRLRGADRGAVEQTHGRVTARRLLRIVACGGL